MIGFSISTNSISGDRVAGRRGCCRQGAKHWQALKDLANGLYVGVGRGQQRPQGGEQERLFHYLHGYGGLIPVQVLHLRGRLDPDLVRQGLAYLQRQHPILRAHIRYGEVVFRDKAPFAYRQPYLDTAGTTEIPLRVVTDPVPEAWQRELDAELTKPIGKGKHPRMRATLVRTDPDAEHVHLFFAADHVCADAQAQNMGSRHFLEFLADPAKAQARVPVHPELPPALEFGMPKRSDSGTKGYEPALRLPPQTVVGGQQKSRVIERHVERKRPPPSRRR